MGAERKDLETLEARLGWRFQNPSLLQQALTHPSYTQQFPEAQPHNQRLEFLGDAVLGIVLAERLYHDFPREREGVLTRNRAALANGEQQAALARTLGLGEFLRLSESEDTLGTRNRTSALADAVEALLGAAYLDGGMPAAKALVENLYGNMAERLQERLVSLNNKGRLQERIQPQVPVYELLASTGPDHARQYEVRVLLEGVERGRGQASSKQKAEEIAARAALEFLDPPTP